MSKDAQQILAGFSRDELKAIVLEAVEEVLRKSGILAAAKKESWDHAYKGDARWREYRARVLHLVQANVVITFSDLDQDPWFTKVAGTNDLQQWLRALRAHLVPNKPPGEDGLELASFSVSATGGKFATRRDWLHCAIAAAVRRLKGRDDPALVREVRAKYHAEGPCGLCRPPTQEAERE